MALDHVQWPGVLDILMKRFQHSFRQASCAVNEMCDALDRPVNLGLFVRNELTSRENDVASAICERHGTDSITLVASVGPRMFPGWLDYRQMITLRPSFRRGRVGRMHARIRIAVGSFSFTVRRARAVLALQGMFFVIACLVFATVGALLLYSFSVFYVFLHAPRPMVSAATRNGSLGLALLALLVALAALSGRAVRNTLGELARQFRARRRNSPEVKLTVVRSPPEEPRS